MKKIIQTALITLCFVYTGVSLSTNIYYFMKSDECLDFGKGYWDYQFNVCKTDNKIIKTRVLETDYFANFQDLMRTKWENCTKKDYSTAGQMVCFDENFQNYEKIIKEIKSVASLNHQTDKGEESDSYSQSLEDEKNAKESQDADLKNMKENFDKYILNICSAVYNTESGGTVRAQMAASCTDSVLQSHIHDLCEHLVGFKMCEDIFIKYSDSKKTILQN